MDPNDYRKQVEKEVEESRAEAALQTAAPDSVDPAARSAAIGALGNKITTDDASFDKLLGQLADPAENPAVRVAALTAIQVESFKTATFHRRLPAWTAALRGLASDLDPDIRLRALSILSNKKDGHAQELLLQGLREPAKAVVPVETALQLLSNDIHAEVYPFARAIAANPPSEVARHEALRVLGADAQSVPLFEGILRDRKESSNVRRLAIAALDTLSPTSLRKHAQEVVMDENDDADVVATSLAALAHSSLPVSADLSERVAELHSKGAPEVQVAAARLQGKLGD